MFSEGNRFSGSDRNERLSQSVEIVRLSEDNWAVLRDLKLKALDQEPVAFEDPEKGREKYLSRSEEEWRAILSEQATEERPFENKQVFARDEDGEFIGMVSSRLPINDGSKRRAVIQQMFVDVSARGRRVGRELLEGLLNRLRNTENVQGADLEVVSTQGPAISLYKSLGFVEKEVTTGTARRGKSEYDEIHMSIDFEDERE